MKYSLRSLMTVVTLGCALVGGLMARVNYLSRMADYHDRLSVVLMGKRGGGNMKTDFEIMDRSPDLYLEMKYPAGMEWADTLRLEQEAFIHRHLAKEYRRAIHHPWIIVDESSLIELHQTP